MAKHRVNRRKFIGEPTIKQDKPSPKSKPIRHSKSYYKPKKLPRISVPTPTQKHIVPVSETSIKELQKAEEKHRKSRKGRTKKIRKELRRQKRIERKRQKEEHKNIRQAKRKHTEVKQGGRYTVTPVETPTETTWEWDDRNEDYRTETLYMTEDDTDSYIFDLLLTINTVIANLEQKNTIGGWNSAGVKPLYKAMDKLQEVMNLSYVDKLNIVGRLSASLDIERIKDIVQLQIYDEVSELAYEVQGMIEGIVDKYL